MKRNEAGDDEIPPYLIGDPVRLQRIILELVTNALRFTQEGTIDVEAKLKKHETQQDVIEIKVRDTGIGISKDKQDEIFTRFTRLTPAYQGTLKHRDQLLNSQVPGLSSQQAHRSDPYDAEEMLKIAKDYERDPSDKNRKRYIKLTREVAEARFKK